MHLCEKKDLTVTDIVAKGYKIRFLNGHIAYLDKMEESEKKRYLVKCYPQIEKVYSKKNGLLGLRLNQYGRLLTPKQGKGIIKKERTGRQLPVRSKIIERKYLQDDRKLAKQYPTIADKIQAAFVVRLTNQERKELTVRLKRLGAKHVMIEDLTEGNRITTEPVHYIKYLFN